MSRLLLQTDHTTTGVSAYVLSVISFIAYMLFSLLLLLIVSVRAYTQSKWYGLVSFHVVLRRMACIYLPVLVHIFDTSTDIAVLVLWAVYAIDEMRGYNHENVNMLSFLIPSVVLIFVYRSAFMLQWYVVHRDHWRSFDVSLSHKLGNMFLILTDLTVHKLVYKQLRLQYLSPCLIQRRLTFVEAVFESMPQLVFQSVFVIRTYNTEVAAHHGIDMVYLSLVASVLSIFSNFDREDVEYTIKPFVCNIGVKLFRICEIVARYAIFTLLWAVLSGFHISIYLFADFCVYYYMETKTGRFRDNKDALLIVKGLYAVQAVVGVHIRRNIRMIMVRFADNAITLIAIFLFGLSGFDCFKCHDVDERNVEHNPYMLGLLIMATAGTVISFVMYLVLYHSNFVSVTSKRSIVKMVDIEKLTQGQQQQISVSPEICERVLGLSKYLEERSRSDVACSASDPKPPKHETMDEP